MCSKTQNIIVLELTTELELKLHLRKVITFNAPARFSTSSVAGVK